jgi:hypothetical protein
MNPPPIPSPNDNNSIAHQAAKAALIATLLAIGLTAIVRSSPIGDLFAGALILAGFVAAIVALAGIPAYGTRGLLGRGLAGLVINAILIVIFTTNFVAARRKAAASRAAWQDVRASTDNLQSDLKKSFDPKTGITNVDLQDFTRVRDRLQNASQNLSGDDASLAKVMAAYFDRMQGALRNYQTAVTDLREAHVLAKFDPIDPKQFAGRREKVQQFLDANSALKQVITNAEVNIRDGLLKEKVSKTQVDRFLAGYHSSAAPINAITLQIRQCDDRMGAAMLDALTTLESRWGHWKCNSADQILFDESITRSAYNDSVNALNAAAKEQLKLQGELVNRQHARQDAHP